MRRPLKKGVHEVVRWDDIEVTCVAALKLHISEAGHPGDDVVVGCDGCRILLALPFSLRKDINIIEV